MNSHFLKTLEEKISGSTGAVRDELRVERAAYLARSGQTAEAWDEISTMRSDSSALRHSRVSALLNFAEGLYHYYRDVSPIAQDRFARARAIAQIGSHSDLEARAVSWLGLVHYGSYRFGDMCSCIDDCIERIESNDTIALARTSLTIAISIHLANRFDLAMPWYRRAHLFAVETHDEAMISAMLHNMAALWLSNCRNAQLGGPPTADQSRQALMGALSSLNFDGLVGLSALGVLTPLLDAQISSLDSDFQRAADLYERCRAEFDVDALHNWSTWMLADREWCRLKNGCAMDAREALDSIYDSIDDAQQIDEQAATFARLAQAWRLLGNVEADQKCEKNAQRCWRQFVELQANILEQILSTRGVLRLAQRFPI